MDEQVDPTVLPSNDGIGIDLGIKNLAVCSDKNTYKNIYKTQKTKKLEKHKRRLQHSISKRYEIGNCETSLYTMLSIQNAQMQHRHTFACKTT